MLMHLFGVNDCRRLFSDKLYRVVTMTFPIRDANDINTNTAIAAIRPEDIDEGQLQLDGDNVDVFSDKEDDGTIKCITDCVIC